MPIFGSDQLAAILAKQIVEKNWIWHFNNPHRDISGVWIVSANPTQYLGAVLSVAAPALNDEFSIPLLVFTTRPITLNIRGVTLNNHGISSVYIDGVLQGTIDWYDVAGANNEIKTLPITPARIGANALRFKMTSKNGSSIGYGMKVSEMWLS